MVNSKILHAEQTEHCYILSQRHFILRLPVEHDVTLRRFYNIVQGPLGLPGRPGDPGEKGEPGKPGLQVSSLYLMQRMTSNCKQLYTIYHPVYVNVILKAKLQCLSSIYLKRTDGKKGERGEPVCFLFATLSPFVID